MSIQTQPHLKKIIIVLISLLMVMTIAGAAPAQATPPRQEPVLPMHAAGRLIVKPASGISVKQVEPLKVELQAATVKRFPLIGAELWQIDGISVAEAIAQFGDDPRLEYIEPDYQVTVAPIASPDEPPVWPNIQTTPNDTYYTFLWGLNNTGQTGGTTDADIDAPEAWSTQTGNNVLVAVIDTGVDYNHPDLAANIWTNPGEIAGNGLDDDNNGYVDDIHGWDFAYDDNDPMDGAGHGTHCAGTIAAVGNNSRGVTGVNWSARIMALKFLDDSGSGWTSDALDALQYAIDMDAQLTSNSWGGGSYSQGMYDAIAAAGVANQLFVAAAGNDGTDNDSIPHYPSNYNLDNVISVAATDHNDARSYFSNYGATSVDLGAPGSAIYSTLPGNSYGSYNGTSMATPHVSGAASLIWAQYPSYSYSTVRQLILSGVDPIPALAGKTTTGGRLNIQNSLAAPDSTAPAAVANLAVSTVGADRITLTWTAPGDDGTTGTATAYDIRYAAVPISTANFGSAATVAAPPTPQSAGATETFTVTGLTADTQYYFALKTLDEFDNESGVSNSPTGTTLGPPDIDITPAAIEITMQEGETATRTLTIANTGESTLSFSLSIAGAEGIAKNLSPQESDSNWHPVTFPTDKIDPALQQDLGVMSGEPTSFLVYLTEQADLSGAYRIDNWAERGRYVYDTLYQTAQQSQAEVIAALGPEAVQRTFYIVNAIAATGSLNTITALANRADVVYIEAMDTYAIPEPQPGADLGIAAVEWGVGKIGADQVWADFNIRGDGMVIASIDTGVYSQHSALINQYRGTATGSHNYNWFDPGYTYPYSPGDNNGHGTHTVGTMVGADSTAQPGVAPEAQWIAAKGCGSSSCDGYDLLYAAEWVLAPYPIGGSASNGDPNQRPHVVNNSWGGGGGDLWYQIAVQAWRAAGIFPAFAAGNSGPSAGTIGSPGDYADSFASGATDSSDNIAAFSSRGPSSLTGETKPDISAPGYNIRSASTNGGYILMSGTSMASPHTAGCAALVMEADPTLEVSEVEDLLTSTAVDLGSTGPDDAYGYGRLDCYEAVATARAGVINWLSAGPVSGQVAPGGSLDIELDFNSTGLDLGDYEAVLTITSNDPDESPQEVPVTLHVTDCAAGAAIPPGPTVYLAAGPFTVTTVISNVTDLGGFEFDMLYDPALLQVTAVSVADFPASTGRTFTPVGPIIDNSGGQTTFGAFSMGSTVGPSGNGALAWVTFEPQQTGQSSLNLQNLQVTDSAGENLPTCPVNSQVNIEACYPVDFDCDCDVDIVDVLEVAQSWSCEAGEACYVGVYDLDQDQDIDIIDIMRVVPHWGWDCADSTGPASQQVSSQTTTAATISLSPTLPNITEPGQLITVDVLIEGANTLGGFEFDVTFPAEMVQVDEVALGDFLTSGDIHPLTPIVDNEAGTVSFGGFSIGTAGHSGSGVLGTITFISSQAGQPELALEGAQLATTEGETQPVKSTAYKVFLPLIIK